MKVKVGTAVLFLIALLAAAVLASAAAGSVVIGSDLAQPPDANGTCGSASCTVVQTVSAPATPLKSPVNGAVVSWSTIQGATGMGTSGNLRLRIIRDAGAGTYTAVRSGPTTSIPTNLPHPEIAISVKPGLPISQNDYVGVDVLDSTSALATRAIAGFTFAFFSPALADGATLAPNNPVTREALLQATIEPTNTFSIGAVTRNKKKGTATVSLALPNPGVLTGSGNGASVASATGAVISKSAAAGPAALLIKAAGRKTKRKLNATGKVKLKVAITYTPTYGAPDTQSTKVKLKKNL